jgi:glyoxylase-like metal-dependent hydrolase (beta-lactamase superfamily II)
LICLTARLSVLIDPAGEPDTLLEMLADSEPAGILLTHSHMDHIGALEEMRSRLKVPVMAHVGGTVPDVDRWLNDGDLIDVGDYALKVHYTPGHTDDIVCFAIVDDNRVIVGDAIFEGGPGHTSSPQAFETTLQTLREIILTWPDSTVCYPGHGVAFRLGDKRADIEAFLSKDHGRFFGDATWDM